MSTLFTTEQALQALPHIEDERLSKAVSLATWLYLERRWRLKLAVDKAAQKHSVKARTAMYRILRQVIPEEVFRDRSH